MLERPIIYQISEGRLTASNFFDRLPDFLSVVRSSAAAGITAFQIREKLLPARLVFELAVRTADVLRDYDVALFINDRADIALAAGASGVHLTSQSIVADSVRRVFPELLIAVSVHNLEEAIRARDAGADLLVFGPVFSTPGKGAPVGIEKLAEAVRAVAPVPVAGLGGINAANCDDVLAVSDGFAAIRGFSDTRFIAGITR